MPAPADNHDFAAGLLDPQQPVPAGLTGPGGKGAEKRYAVYRNNVTVGLIDALGEIFPTVRRLVGENNFRAMARDHVRASPPGSPLIFEYGADFADFVEDFEPVRNLVYLPDVARLERLWLDAYHAADAAPLPPSALSTIAEDAFAKLTFTPHPAARILRSPHAAVSIVSRDRQGASLEGLDPLSPEDALITRPDAAVELRLLAPGAALFFQTLFAGRTLGEAVEAGAGEAPDFDLARAISTMLQSGAFAALGKTG